MEMVSEQPLGQSKGVALTGQACTGAGEVLPSAAPVVSRAHLKRAVVMKKELWRERGKEGYDSDVSDLTYSEEDLSHKEEEEEMKKKAAKRANAAKKRANRQKKKLIVEEAKITGEDDPEAKKPRTDGN